MLDPMKKEFAVFTTTIFQGNANSTVYYNQTFSIPNEGVFSTFFLFGKHKPIEPTSSLDDDIGDFIDDLFGEDEDKTEPGSPNHNIRVLQPSEPAEASNDLPKANKQKPKTQLILNGQISFVNSFGFLNAD